MIYQIMWFYIILLLCCCWTIIQPVQAKRNTCQTRCGLLSSYYYTGVKGTNTCQDRCIFSIFGHILRRIPTGYQCGRCYDIQMINECTTTDSNTDPTTTYDICLKLLIDPQDLNLFNIARKRWSQIIRSDMPDQLGLSILKQQLPCGSYPKRIDDLYICGAYEDIDGLGKILGYAGALYTRLLNRFNYVGVMVFDVADVINLRDKNRLLDVILHEMGHIIGISQSSFERKNLMTTFNTILDGEQCTYNGINANREYQKITNCTSSSVPMEEDGGSGTRCSHWDEFCFKNELMTGFLSGSIGPISTITIGALNDLGYNVDYNQADILLPTDINPSCLCNNTNRRIMINDDNSTIHISHNGSSKRNNKNNKKKVTDSNNYPNSNSNNLYGDHQIRKKSSAIHIDSSEQQEVINNDSKQYDKFQQHHNNRNNDDDNNHNNPSNNNKYRHHHRLSEIGYQQATEYGRKILKDKYSSKEVTTKNNFKEDQDWIYIGDQGITVLYLENDIIHDVHVTPV